MMCVSGSSRPAVSRSRIEQDGGTEYEMPGHLGGRCQAPALVPMGPAERAAARMIEMNPDLYLYGLDHFRPLFSYFRRETPPRPFTRYGVILGVGVAFLECPPGVPYS